MIFINFESPCYPDAVNQVLVQSDVSVPSHTPFPSTDFTGDGEVLPFIFIIPVRSITPITSPTVPSITPVLSLTSVPSTVYTGGGEIPAGTFRWCHIIIIFPSGSGGCI